MVSVLPIIDLSRDRSTVVRELRDACTTKGFFYIINHGVSPELMDKMFAQSRRFFEQSEEIKRQVLADSNNRGFTPMKEEALDPANQKVGDTKEGYYIGRDVPADSEEAKRPLHGPNQWPSEASLPGWRSVMEEYYVSCLSVGKFVVRMLGEVLGLPEGFFDRPGVLDKPLALLRLLHYSSEASNPSEGIYACGAHSDYGLITLLATDEQQGLEVFLRDALVKGNTTDMSIGTWFPVQTIKHAFIVNLGDIFEHWTNGTFVSTRHRVLLPPGGKERYSTPFFFEPNFDCLIEVLPECVSESKPVKFAPIKYGQYLLDKYQSTHSDFAMHNADGTGKGATFK